MIVCNDVMAYLFGFFFGRTPLIKLSPKKTWEGFIGGGFATVIFGVVFSYFLCQYQFFICPIEYNEAAGRMAMECEPSYLFRPQEYSLSIVRSILELQLIYWDLVNISWEICTKFFFRFQFKINKTLTIYPFLLHSLSMSVFSSVIGPFGGFFASGFKRAFKIKVWNFILLLFDKIDNKNSMAFWTNLFFHRFKLKIKMVFAGFWWYDSRPWWYYGSIRLSIFDGNICKRLHFQLYTHRITSKTVATGKKKLEQLFSIRF